MIKIQSLNQKEQFRKILGKKKLNNNYFTIYFGKNIYELNKNNNKLNISFIMKKKIGNAVKRNKIKRRLKNMTNDAIKKISINFNYSYLVIAKNKVLSDEYENIKKTLFANFERIKQ